MRKVTPGEWGAVYKSKEARDYVKVFKTGV